MSTRINFGSVTIGAHDTLTARERSAFDDFFELEVRCRPLVVKRSPLRMVDLRRIDKSANLQYLQLVSKKR